MQTNEPTPNFQELVLNYQDKIYNLCWYLLKNKADAQDCTQDIFIAIFQALPKFKQQASINTWVYRISTNKCYEFQRRSKRKKRFGLTVPIDDFFTRTISAKSNNPEEIQVAAEQSVHFWKAVESLPLQQQLAYTLFNIEQMSYKEIAQALDTSVGAVESMLFRARQKLAAALKEWSYQ